MEINFNVPIKGVDGEEKPGEPVGKFLAKIFEGYGNYDPGDKVAVWDIIGRISNKGEVELEDNEVELLRKYWKQMTDESNIRLDLDMAVRDVLDIDE